MQLAEWLELLRENGWTLQFSSPLTRTFVHDVYDAHITVGLNAENLIECEVSGFLPSTFIYVTSNKFVVNDPKRYEYVTLLAQRITHACRMYNIGGTP